MHYSKCLDTTWEQTELRIWNCIDKVVPKLLCKYQNVSVSSLNCNEICHFTRWSTLGSAEVQTDHYYFHMPGVTLVQKVLIILYKWALQLVDLLASNRSISHNTCFIGLKALCCVLNGNAKMRMRVRVDQMKLKKKVCGCTVLSSVCQKSSLLRW